MGDLRVMWLNILGGEVQVGSLTAGEPVSTVVHPGNVHRIYTASGTPGGGRLLMEYTATSEEIQIVQVEMCEVELKKPTFTSRRAEEFENLLIGVDGELPPCGPEGGSDAWSCVRFIPRDVCDRRHANDPDVTEGKEFGFKVKNEGGHNGAYWEPGSFEDIRFDFQIKSIPRVSHSRGFQVMNMTTKLRDSLLPWYEKSKLRARKQETVPGGYLNDNVVTMHLVDLSRDARASRSVDNEMSEILQWWTNRRLKPTSTFGVRVYRRGSTLLNHVDRKDSHIVSAVLQVAQDVDEDEGWPLEVLSGTKDCYEVYLQPGQMVLYEGARFKHGRPMVFRGDEFANLFVHYAPVGWAGPGEESFFDHDLEHFEGRQSNHHDEL